MAPPTPTTHQLSILISPKKKTPRHCLQKELLKNKYIVVMGGSIQRSIYKDLIRLFQGNTFLNDTLLRMKGEDSCLKDMLLDGGMRGKDKKGIGYREVGQYHTDFYFLQFVFMTRCYNTYVESVISKFESAEQKPDVIIVNSCLWDITRYGDRPVPEYKENLEIVQETEVVIT